MASDSRDVVRNPREVAENAPTVAPMSTPATPGIDDEEPSAEWGWHGSFPKGRVAGGVLTIILCLAFIPGDYQSKTQYLWLIGIAVIVLGGIVAQVVRKRNSWRR